MKNALAVFIFCVKISITNCITRIEQYFYCMQEPLCIIFHSIQYDRVRRYYWDLWPSGFSNNYYCWRNCFYLIKQPSKTDVAKDRTQRNPWCYSRWRGDPAGRVSWAGAGWARGKAPAGGGRRPPSRRAARDPTAAWSSPAAPRPDDDRTVRVHDSSL